MLVQETTPTKRRGKRLKPLTHAVVLSASNSTRDEKEKAKQLVLKELLTQIPLKSSSRRTPASRSDH